MGALRQSRSNRSGNCRIICRHKCGQRVCVLPRLFFYEWVEGLFVESVDTVEGSIQHRRSCTGKGKW